MGKFLADVDRDRQFWSEPNGDSVIHTILAWASGDGFPAFVERYDIVIANAHEFRNRVRKG